MSVFFNQSLKIISDTFTLLLFYFIVINHVAQKCEINILTIESNEYSLLYFAIIFSTYQYIQKWKQRTGYITSWRENNRGHLWWDHHICQHTKIKTSAQLSNQLSPHDEFLWRTCRKFFCSDTSLVFQYHMFCLTKSAKLQMELNPWKCVELHGVQ